MTIASNVVILIIGVVVMAVALARAIGFDSLRLTRRSRNAWIILILLMLLFIIGYIAALVLVLRGHLHYLSALTSLVFSVGAIFVLFTVDFALSNMRTLMEFSQSLEEQTHRLIENASELENTNRRLGIEIAERQKADEALQGANAELVVARDQALEGSLAKTQFLMNMSHELRTPLNHVLGYSDILKEELAESENRSLLPDVDRIQNSARHLLSLIDDILDISRIETGTVDLSLEAFEPSEVIRSAVSALQPEFRKNSNTVEMAGDADLGTMISDPARFRQILVNLLGNAAKFTENGTIRLETIRENMDGADWIQVRVCDTGIGITPQQLPTLFQPFRQADNTASRKYGGAGLGLAISRHFCGRMGGSITVESTPGKGSAFTVRLPAELRDSLNAEC